MMQTNFWKIENETLIPLECGTNNIAGTSPYTPVGAYTTFRTYGRFGVLRLTKHLDRLEETSRLAGYQIRLDRPKLKETLTELVSASDPGEKRIRITVDLEKQTGTLYIAMEDLAVPAAEKYRNGIDCGTVEAHRDNPKAKLSSFLGKASDLRSRTGSACDELLMYTSSGDILEGLSSNFYGVIGNSVFTADEGVLSGTTRDFILKIAEDLNIPVILRPVNLSEVTVLDEAFISSTSRSILPVRTIAGTVMKQAVPGPVTRQLTEGFESMLQAAIEDLRNI